MSETRASSMTALEAQADMRRAYANAGPGQVVVGLIWIAAGIVFTQSSLEIAFVTLFLACFLIYPITLLIVRGIMRRPAEAKGNVMIPVVPEGLPIMVSVLFAAWMMMPYRPDAVIPLAAIATGAHYIPFQTAYGIKLFWFAGGLIAFLGFGAIYGPVPTGPVLMFLVGGFVLSFGLLLWLRGGKP